MKKQSQRASEQAGRYEAAPTGGSRPEDTGEMPGDGLNAGVQDPASTSVTDDAEAIRMELDSMREQMLRTAAEFQNYRRRTEQEKALLVEYGKSVVLQKLLDVVDDLERSIDASDRLAQTEAGGPAFDALRLGVDMIYRKFLEEMKKLGVQPIEAFGKPFDPHEHEALMQRPAPEGTDEGIVLDEMQRGYRMGDRILRHAKVVVAS